MLKRGGSRTVAVAGGGIGGLAAAVALHRRGWRVTVLERADRFTEIGAGLSLWPNGVRALAALGLADRVRAVAAVEAAGGVRDRAGRWLARLDNAEIARRHGFPLLLVRRADLLRTLMEAVPAAALRPGSEVCAVRPDGDEMLVEYRGGVLRADLVVAADGVASGLRSRYWPGAGEPRYVGYTAWRMVTEPLPGLRPAGSVIWGRGERFGYAALPGERFYCFAAATVPAGASGESDVQARFEDWPEPVPQLLKAVPPEATLRHDVYAAPALRSYVRGRLVLLGDSAHAMDPLLGQGACQAIEDAVTLAACVDGVAAAGLETALARYDRLRRPRARAVARRSARLGRLAQLSSPVAASARDLITRAVPAGLVLRSMAPVLGWRPPGPGS